MRVLIADDHALVRAGVRQILAKMPEVDVIGEACDTQQVLEQVSAHSWNLLILDLSMPGRSGLEVLKHVQQIQPGLRVLVFTIHAESQFAGRLLKAGAAGFLNKEAAAEQLAGAVRKVLSGGRFISAALAEKLAVDRVLATGVPDHESLSDREFEVLRLLAHGHTVSTIAASLSISVKTVSTYRARILEKLALRTNVDLIQYALVHKLIE